MPNKTITIYGESQKEHAKGLVDQMPKGAQIRFMPEPKRTDLQNAKLWPMLKDVADQVEWHGETLTATEWKDVFTAALQKQKMVRGIDGGLVFVGSHTSVMRVAEFADLIECIYAFGASHNVEWSEPFHSNEGESQ